MGTNRACPITKPTSAVHDPNISVVSASLYLAKTFAIFESPTQQNKVCYVRITLFIVGNKICNIRSHVQSRLVQFEKTRRGVGRRQPTYRLVFSNCISIGSTFYGLDNQVVWREGQDIGMWICVVIPNSSLCRFRDHRMAGWPIPGIAVHRW